jgi:uncharacterized protein YjbJ (UPF0337 family)
MQNSSQLLYTITSTACGHKSNNGSHQPPHNTACDSTGTARSFSKKRSRCALPLHDNEDNKEVAMDWNRVEGNWKQLKGRVKEQWGKLTDDDLDQIGGGRDQLEGKIQERYGLERDRAKRDIDDWYNRQTWQ